MAILWMDGFDTYATVNDVAIRYAGSNTGLMILTTTSGRFGGGAVACSNTGTSIAGMGYMAPAVIPHTTTAVIAGGAHLTSTNTATYCCMCWVNTLGNATGTNELTLFYESGLFKLYRGPGTTLLATSSLAYGAGLWHHIEAKTVIADSGSCEVRINGVVAINFTGDTRASTTGTAGVDKVGFPTGSSSVAGGCWDDIYILDTSGSVANNFLGDCRINTLAPTSDSAVQFTRSTGASNYLCVDEGRYNGDTDYVESATVGHVDKYGYQDLAAGVATVYGVQATCWAKKTDATTRTMRQNIYSNATTSAQTAFGLSTTYGPYFHLLTLNPDGSVQWTPTTVNAALAGVEVVS